MALRRLVAKLHADLETVQYSLNLESLQHPVLQGRCKPAMSMPLAALKM